MQGRDLFPHKCEQDCFDTGREFFLKRENWEFKYVLPDMGQVTAIRCLRRQHPDHLREDELSFSLRWEMGATNGEANATHEEFSHVPILALTAEESQPRSSCS